MAVVGKKRKNKTTYYVVTFFNERQYYERSGTDKSEAERLDTRRKREVKEGRFAPEEVAPAKAFGTVSAYAENWGARRTNITAAHDRRNVGRFLRYPEFAGLAPDSVRPRHVIATLNKMKASGEHSRKTLQNSYGSLRTMFRDAHIEEVIDRDPCVLPRNFFGDEPTPEREVYTRAEAAVLVSHNQIPEAVRVLNALCLLGGLREGEACGRRWRDIDHDTAPLWGMTVATQYDALPLKTKKPRVVPVHPELAGILQAWASGGFVVAHGRQPQPDDFIVPYVSARARGGFYTRSVYYKAFVAGCLAAGIRPRSLHSTRHTMVTMARRGGADRQVLSKVTHNAKGDMIDRYTHHEWEPLCQAVLAIGSLFSVRPSPGGMRDLPQTTSPNSITLEGDKSAPMRADSTAGNWPRGLQFPAPPPSAEPKKAAENKSVKVRGKLASAGFGAHPRSSDPSNVARSPAETAGWWGPAEPPAVAGDFDFLTASSGVGGRRG